MNNFTNTNALRDEIRELVINARQHVAVQVNTELLSTYWNIGKVIVEYEQESKERADYGKQMLKLLSRNFLMTWQAFLDSKRNPIRLLNCISRKITRATGRYGGIN